jgi:hypothetical protein
VNGSPSKTFNVSRGLHQGDPLSPFLYIILVEGLGRSLSRAKRKGDIKGISLHQGEEALSHLQFVDDNILMGLPTVKEVQEFKKILDLFNLASGMSLTRRNPRSFSSTLPKNPMTSGHPARISTLFPPNQIFRSPPPPQSSP